MDPEHTPTASPAELQAVASALENRRADDCERSERVALFVAAIGVRLGLDNATLERLIIAAKLHDIGMAAVPEAVLSKGGPLTAEEMGEVRRHPIESERIVAAAGLADVAGWVRHHHERWDGCGYPDALSGPQIPLESRILSVADALEAMTSERPYRTAMGVEMAAREISASAGTQFDPGIARTVVDLLQKGALRVAGDEARDPAVETLASAHLGIAEYDRVRAALDEPSAQA